MSVSDNELAGLNTGALFQIAEPLSGQGKRRVQVGAAVGIDLGTTHSLVATAARGSAPRTLVVDGPEDAGNAGSAGAAAELLPSVVSYAAGTPIVGRRASIGRAEHPTRVVSSAKRFMGRGVADVDFAHPYVLESLGRAGVLHFDVGDEPGSLRVNPVQVSAEILRALVRAATPQLEQAPTAAVITVPAYFDDAQRQATRDAGRVAGLEVLRLLAEPTAAALAYGLDRGSRGTYAVYDLGGGTFDISILSLRDGVFKVLATGGDAALGGDDFDRALAAELLKSKGGIDEADASVLQRALEQARSIKEELSGAEFVALNPEFESSFADGRVTRAQFEALIVALVRRTIAVCRDTLRQAGLRPRELDGVVMVGGSTRVPLVVREVEAAFKRQVFRDLDPDRVVAYGAAIQADVLSGSPRDGVTLLDVAPLSLGLETMGGIVEKIIPRNATIPIAARQTFTNYSEKQTGMSIKVVQGERELASDCRLLAEFDLKGIPALPPSMARVEVTFELDADGLLTVTARELMTGQKQSVEVKPSHGLSGEEVERLVDESLESARDDLEARNTAEARVELGRVVLSVESAIAELGSESERRELLSDDESAQLREALKSARARLDASESGTGDATQRESIVAARKALEAISEPFARRRMEHALRSGMAGKAVHDIEERVETEGELDAKRGGHFATPVD